MEFLTHYNTIYRLDEGNYVELLLYNEASHNGVLVTAYGVYHCPGFDIAASNFRRAIYSDFVLEGIRENSSGVLIKLQNGDVIQISEMPENYEHVIRQVVRIYNQTEHRQIIPSENSSIYELALRRYEGADEIEIFEHTP